MTNILAAIAKRFKPPRLYFSRSQERRFKHLLTKVKVKCRIYPTVTGRIVAVRPMDVQAFEKLLIENGLANCRLAMDSARWMAEDAGAYLKFVT